MKRASLPLRLDRLAGQRHAADRERIVRELAAESGLDPAEVRAEYGAITERIRRFGPEAPEQLVRRWAEEFRLPEHELWEEYGRITGAVGSWR